ncbi:MAG: hypothetical protein WC977_10690 [Anaerovoracaceae bacterium]|jgi:DeoR/GlpR family transcriptional regulator of sugar metabolism
MSREFWCVTVDFDEQGKFQALRVTKLSVSYQGRTSRAYSAMRRRREQFVHNTHAAAQAAMQQIEPATCAVCQTGRSYYVAVPLAE